MKMQTEEMLTALVQLHNVLQEVELPLDVPGATDQRIQGIGIEEAGPVEFPDQRLHHLKRFRMG